MNSIDQNNPNDKFAQVQTMHRVYSGALFTIFAASGSDSEAGLCGVQAGSRAVNHISEMVNGKEIFVSLPLLTEALESVGGSPGEGWINRGWTMQEGLLSRRCLIFTESQVFWKCCKELCCESIAEVFEHQRESASPPRRGEIFCADRLLRNLDGGATAYEGTNCYYFEVVCAYTKRVLSFDSDRLHAFQGISNAMQITFGSKILWGLAEDILDLSLLWVPTSLDIEKKRDTRFPSWSWASWLGSVDYYVLSREAYPNDSSATYASGDVVKSASSIRKTNSYWKFNKKGKRKEIVQKLVRYPGKIEEKYDLITEEGHLKYVICGGKYDIKHYNVKQLSEIDPPTGDLNPDILASLSGRDNYDFFPVISFITTTITLYLVRAASDDERAFQCRFKPMSEGRDTGLVGDLDESIFVDDTRDLRHVEGKGCELILLSRCEAPGTAVMNVMLIKRLRNGVSRRMGIGYVLPETWEQANPMQEWVWLR
jgi:hypothetical protein